jgi:hypothetical protein
MSDKNMLVSVASRLRQIAETEQEPIRTLMFNTAEKLQSLAIEFNNRLQVILSEVELAIVDVYQRERQQP